MYTFNKSERLCSQKLIEELYHSGHRIIVFPYSVTWKYYEGTDFEEGAQALITTSKRKFHHAVDRNRVKRLTRECYRLHKPEFYEMLAQHEKKLIISFNYIHTEILSYRKLSKKFDKIMMQLNKELSK